MSKISFLLRKTSKGSAEEQIYVKHTHQGSPLLRATGAQVPPEYFNLKTGKVSNKLPRAPELNAAVEEVRGDIEKAARNLSSKGVEPIRKHLELELDNLQRKKFDKLGCVDNQRPLGRATL
jgi:hypothetical protein